jgi:hypothetical protein
MARTIKNLGYELAAMVSTRDDAVELAEEVKAGHILMEALWEARSRWHGCCEPVPAMG